jgi:predicted O-methyltransferase YrrM
MRPGRLRSSLDALTKARWFRDWAKTSSFAVFRVLDRVGVHVLPKHYYSPIPDYHWLRRHRHAWVRRISLDGAVDWDLDEQLTWVTRTCQPYLAEVAGLGLYEQVTATGVGIGFGPIDSQVLHCVVRSTAPTRIIEIGSGFSTLYLLNAAARNESEGRGMPHITSIEPNPRRDFRAIQGLCHIEKPCQEVPLSEFRRLDVGDLLFIDSSHSVKVGSDVVRIYLEILPNLRSGVIVHIHDINFPYAYPRDALSGFWGSQETALLLALLIGNPHLRVLSSLSALAYEREEELIGLFPDYRRTENDEGLRADRRPNHWFPRSTWLTTA